MGCRPGLSACSEFVPHRGRLEGVYATASRESGSAAAVGRRAKRLYQGHGGSHVVTRHGPNANSDACGGCVEPWGRVSTALPSELRVRNGA
jgi:hypothetical protein